MSERWHKGSRFWIAFPWIVVISGVLTWLLKEPNIWIATVPPLVLGAGAQTVVRHHHDGSNSNNGED